MEIKYDQGGELIGHKFKNILIEEEYGIKTKPSYFGNLQEKTTIEGIHQSLGKILWTYNLHETYVDDADTWMGIIAAYDFGVLSTYH